MNQLNLKIIDLRFKESNHSYLLNGELVPGCSSIAGILPKGFLAPWASKLAVETIERLIKPNTKYTKNELTESLALAKIAHTVRKDTAMETGTKVHALLEAHIKTGKEIPKQEDSEVQECVNRFMEWVNKSKIRWLASELLVGSEIYKFGGQLDAVAELDGKLVLIDFKSSKQIAIGEFGLQTIGYQIALEELGCRAIEERIIVRLPKDGSDIEIHKIETNPEEDKAAFLAARALYPYIKKVEKMEREKWQNTKK